MIKENQYQIFLISMKSQLLQIHIKAVDFKENDLFKIMFYKKFLFYVFQTKKENQNTHEKR